MGQNNRQRRAAKQRQRAQNRRSRGAHEQAQFIDAQSIDDALMDDAEPYAARILLAQFIGASMHGVGGSSPDLEAFGCVAERHQQAAIDEQFDLAVDAVINSGWTPLDLYEVVRRKTAARAGTHLIDVVAAATARQPRHLVHAQWLAQLNQLGTAAPAPGGRSPSAVWAQRSGLDWRSALEQLLAVLVVVCALPVIERVVPPPGESASGGPASGGPASGGPASGGPASASDDGIDAKVLRRIRGLLAKAESTEHPDEADALSAKAQQLMTRYSIERAVAESNQPVGRAPICRRMWLENPYVDAKALLIDVVADANNCRAVQFSTWGFVTIVGHAADVDLVELLVTSLLVQATRALTMAGAQVSRAGTSRTRSFRQSFLVSYAGRIGERLHESARAAETDFHGGHGGALVPVLAARRQAVSDTMHELFPTVVERRVSASNHAGWGAGRAAADLARLDVHESVTG